MRWSAQWASCWRSDASFALGTLGSEPKRTSTMSMVVSLSSLRDETIERLLADPPLVWQVIAPDDAEAYERARHQGDERSKPGLFSRLFGARTQANGPSSPPAGGASSAAMSSGFLASGRSCACFKASASVICAT